MKNCIAVCCFAEMTKLVRNGKVNFKFVQDQQDRKYNAGNLCKNQGKDNLAVSTLPRNKMIVKHINDKTFVEDSLRVYRAIGFSSRFNFEIDSKTKDLCFKIIESKELNFLPKERVFEELKKIFLKS